MYEFDVYDYRNFKINVCARYPLSLVESTEFFFFSYCVEPINFIVHTARCVRNIDAPVRRHLIFCLHYKTVEKGATRLRLSSTRSSKRPVR